MDNLQDLFLELLQVTMGMRKDLSRTPGIEEWEYILDKAQTQSIVGVMLCGLEKLPSSQRPPKMVLLQWIGLAQVARQNTKAMTKASEDAILFFRAQGFAGTILKGSAVGRYYPQPDLRSSGDVDIWLSGGRKKIYRFARKYDKGGKLHGVNSHHIHFPLFENVHLEVHIWPCNMNNPLHNHRFHQFCSLYKPDMESLMPCLAFDRVFILLHCFEHHIGYGVGLRQVMDYYYVIQQGFTEDEKNYTVSWLKKLGLYRFASGLMWIFSTLFGSPSESLLMPANEKAGRFILHEVLQTGNMGHGETRDWGSTKTPFARFLHNIRRDCYFASHYPSEALWQPVFNLCRYLWSLTKR